MITPEGLEGETKSLRAEHQPNSGTPDGFTYFGSLPEISEGDHEDLMPTQDNNAEPPRSIVVNDFVIPSRSQQTMEQHRG